MHHQRHFDRVRGLVSGQTGVPPSEITLETRLFEDLGMNCGEGILLLAVFGSEFRVDLGGIDPLNYFREGSVLAGHSVMIPLVARLSPRFRAYARHCTRGLKALTVRNLVASAQARRWIGPTVARSDADPTRLSGWGRAVLAGSLLAPLLVGLWQYAHAEVAAGQAVETALWTLLLLCGLHGAKFLLALLRLRRLDAAARFEEAAATSGR